MPKLCPNITFPHQQDFFPIRSVTKSSTARFSHENLVEKFKIFVQDFVPIRTAHAVDLYSAVCHDHTYMYTYIVLSRVPSTPACYRGTLGFKEKSECICCGHASGIFSPRLLWFGGCATHATPCSVPGYSYFRMCLEKSEHKLLVQCSNPREFFFYSRV